MQNDALHIHQNHSFTNEDARVAIIYIGSKSKDKERIFSYITGGDLLILKLASTVSVRKGESSCM